MKIIIVLLSLLTKVSMYGQADFSGNWRLNLDKTQFNETPGTPAAARLSVEQKEGTITLQRNDRPKEILKIDSTISVDITEGENKTMVSMKPTSDKLGLIETRTYAYADEGTSVLASKKIRTWTLSADKKILTIHDHIETTKEGVNYNMILVYERQ